MASLKRIIHKSGRVVYRIVICLGYDAQGNKLVKNLTYSVNQSATKRQQEKEAWKYAMDMEDRIKYGHDCDGTKLSFEEFAGKWLVEMKARLACGTYIGYEQLLRSRILPFFRTYKLVQVRTADIEAFYGTLTDTYCTGTIKRYANVLSGIFTAAVRQNLITGNPCREARKPRQKQEEQLRFFTPKQSLLFLKSLSFPYPVPTQFRVFFTLSIFCGFRKGETLALCWEDVDLDRLEISVTKAIGRTEDGFGLKEPKSRTALRRVPFPESILPLLAQYRKEYEAHRIELGDGWRGEDNLFTRSDGSLMGHTTAYQYFIRHLTRYNNWVREQKMGADEPGLEELPAIPLHGLRHSCATLLNYLDMNIVDISRYLGHASCSTTMNIYAHSFEEQKRVASRRLDDFIQKNT